MKIPTKITNFIVYAIGQSINLISPLIVMPYLMNICKENGLGKIGIAFSISLILCCIVDYISCLFLIGSLIFPNFYEKKLLLLSLPIVISQLINPNWFLQGLEKFKVIASLNVISKIIYIGCIFYFIKKQDDYIWANFYLGTSGIIVYIFFLFFYKKEYKISFKKIN